MVFENITIKQFMKAWFNDDYSEISKDDFETAYTEYIDYAGMYATDEFDIITQIHYLNNRINSVKLSVELQKKYIAEFSEPYEPGFKFLKRYGHALKWKNDLVEFVQQLDKVIIKESRHQIELDKAQKDLMENRKKRGQTDEPDKKQTRIQFIQMLNSLGKIGFKIDKNETTVEELAIMIKQQFDETESMNMKYESMKYGRT